MTKINLLHPTIKRPNYDIWFKYEKPESMIDRIAKDMELIRPRGRITTFVTECSCLPILLGATYVELHGEIYQV
jgi:hypothetical protein